MMMRASLSALLRRGSSSSSSLHYCPGHHVTRCGALLRANHSAGCTTTMTSLAQTLQWPAQIATGADNKCFSTLRPGEITEKKDKKMMVASAIALLRRGSSSIHYFRGHYVIGRGAFLQSLQLARCLSTTTAPARSQWLAQTAATVDNKHFCTLRSGVLSPNKPNYVKETTSKLFALLRRGYSSPSPLDYFPKESMDIKRKKKRKERLFVYEGSQSDVIKRLQRIRSSTNCVYVPYATLIASMPTIFASVTPPVSMGFSDITYYIAALALIGYRVHCNGISGRWLNSYVHRLSWQPGSDQIEVVTVSWLGTFTAKTINLVDVQAPPPWNKDPTPYMDMPMIILKSTPSVSFVANGKPYYVELWRFGNAELLEILAPTIEINQPYDCIVVNYQAIVLVFVIGFTYKQLGSVM